MARFYHEGGGRARRNLIHLGGAIALTTGGEGAYDCIMTTNAITALRAMLDADDESAALDNFLAIRALLIDRDDTLLDLYTDRIAPTIRDSIIALIDALPRTELTLLAYDLSLCPLHMRDYAICFDDDDDECAAIRAILPDHDT